MRRKRFRVAVAIAVAMTSWLVVGISPAGAANTPSQSQAGYVGSAQTPFTTGSARITVPTVTCPATGTYSGAITVQWNGDGAGGAGLAQLSISISCTEGTLVMTGGIAESDPTGTGFRRLSVSPGDVLQGSLTYTPASGLIRVSGKNITTGQVVSETGKWKGLSWDSAGYELIRYGIPGSSGPQEVFEFTPVVFSSLTLDGVAAKSKLDGNFVGYDLYNSANTHKLAVANPFNLAGNTFRVRFLAAS